METGLNAGRSTGWLLCRALVALVCVTVAVPIGPLPASIGPAAAASQTSAPVCPVGAATPETIMARVEPPVLIDGTCSDPYYAEDTFVETGRQELTYQVPGGPLIPYTEVTGYFPARTTPLPPGVEISPTLTPQNYSFRFPAEEFWRNRSMQVQHPTTSNTVVDNRLAFTNGAFSINHLNAGNSNAPGHYRHHAAATKVAEAIANDLYGNSDRIYNYYWGCSGGGQMAQAAAEGTTGVWDGIIVACPASRGNPTHAFQWRSLYQFAIPPAQRARIANLRLVGNGVNAADGLTQEERTLLYDGLNSDERSVLNELLSAGFPLNELPTNTAFGSLAPIVGTDDIARIDPTYEDDFWSEPGYEGADPPSYLAAAKMDGFATVTAVNRNGSGAITSIQLNPAEIPAVPPAPSQIGTTGQRFYVYAADGVTRTTDPANLNAVAGSTLSGSVNRTTGLLTLSGTNSPVLLDAVTVGGKIRVNNRFLLSAFYYPRHTIVPGYFNYDQYRNPDGTPIYPQREISAADVLTARQAGGVVESGNIHTRVMLFQNLSDAQAFPSWVAGYANVIESALGPDQADDMLRVYYQERGGHSTGGVVEGVFNQALLELMSWAEDGIEPTPSSRFDFELPLTQVILPERAAQRKGLQPVIGLTANGDVDRAVVGVNQPVVLDAVIQMPPETGEITQYGWTGLGTEPATVLATPNQRVTVHRTATFATPGSYVIRLNVSGQRDGIADPADQTSMQNFREVRVVVQ